jgi:two-component system, chemotaxis family, sensor kinase CheA
MNRTGASIEQSLNAIAAQIPMLEKTDLAPIALIADTLENIGKEEQLPKALKTQIDRTVALVNHIMMDETPFGPGCAKLGESVGKMLKAVGKTGVSCQASAVSDETDQGNPVGHPVPDKTPADVKKESGELPDDLRELAAKFAGNQQAILEDFEAYILEWEKGAPQAKGAVQRILHTWKGEFGVLDMGEFSGLIHEVEERLESNSLSSEQLFTLKDFLAASIDRLAAGVRPGVGKGQRESILGAAGEQATAVRSASQEVTQEGVEAIPQTTAAKAPEVQPQTLEGDPSLIADFIAESREHIHAAETMLLDLETDPANTANIDTIFRAWHTIKGVAGFLNLKTVSTLAHSMESLMDRARKHELVLDPAYIDLLLESNDCLKTYVGFVEAAMGGVTPLKTPDNYDALLKRLTAPAQLNQQRASPEGLTPEKKIGEILAEQGNVPPERIEAALEKQRAGDTRKIGEILIEEKQVGARAVGQALAAQSAVRTGAIEETIRVPVNRIDQLVDAIGEAVIAQSMINADGAIRRIEDQSLHSKISHSEMIMRQIQELAMSLRMVSIKSTFQKMARLVRDLSKKSNKEVNFVSEGEDTELDKSVVENIGDPLIHMIRNAVDHGIENGEDRAASGKPSVATVRLRAYHKAGSIFIEVVDDGKGLDKEAIFAKAVSKNLCKAEAKLTEQEIYAFIFLPGFSTAKTVTDVSGRGVGMDVVRRNIEALRGSVEIQSQRGKGTTFTIRLPLTLAIVDGMIVRSRDQSYIIPTLSIVESIKPADDQINTVLERGEMINVRGELIPLVNLAHIFDKNAMNGHDVRDGVVMIVEDMVGKKMGLEIDEILGQQQVVIKNLGAGIGDVAGISGGAIMSDGRVSLILDISGIAKMAEG